MEVQKRKCINTSYDTENLRTGEENISKEKKQLGVCRAKAT